MSSAQFGLVVHPRRDLDGALRSVREWADRRGVALGQIEVPGQSRRVSEPVDPAACELVLALGGDGTTLAALHASAAASRPVLGVACGSIGVLTAVTADALGSALDQVEAGDSGRRELPALEVVTGSRGVGMAINDFTVIREGTGQVITSITVDSELYARTAGDGVIVATAVGSSAYTMAAGGPILTPAMGGMVITPLAHHGGVAPPLVVAAGSRVELSVDPGHWGRRFELDGQLFTEGSNDITITLRRDYATLVVLEKQESLISGLRRRGLIADSPRIVARDRRPKR